MSSSTYFTHYNETFFPNPRRFIPERWLKTSENGHESVKKYLVCFGKGSRSCLGYNLGTSMLFLTLAAVVTKFDMVPFETDDRDVEIQRDWSIPMGRPDTKGVRAMVFSKIVA
jgi:cytochrome P450